MMVDVESGDVREPAPPEPAGLPPLLPHAVQGLIGPACVVFAGVMVLAAMALWESQQQSGQIWRNAIVSLSGEPIWDGVYTVHTRKLPDENFPPSPLADELRAVEGGAEVIALLGLEMRERVVAVTLPRDVWQGLTATGRAPEPGQREVLAGQLCRLDEFTIDGETFTVSGRLQRGTAGMAFSYLLPYDDTVAPLFADEAVATTGWLNPDGMSRDLSDEEIAALEAEDQQIVAPMAPTTMPVAWGGMFGIVLVVSGGAVFQVRLLLRFARAPIVGAIVAPMREYATLFYAVHALCYGAMIGASLLAFAMPLFNLQVLTFVTEVFTTGELSHLGDAYLSGNVISAAWFTFWNNYVMQTLAYGMAPSLIVPFWGLLKTMLNLAIAGFALAPLWTDLLARFTYHSITLALEMEAYVIAAFGVCLYPVYLWRALQSEDVGRMLRKVPPMLLATVLLSGALLFVAAVYEAVTLIAIG